jgi:hypothetical protein
MDAELSAMNLRMEAHFLPLVREAFDGGGESAAREILSRIPDCVAKVYAMDMIRQLALHEQAVAATNRFYAGRVS